MWGGGLEAQKLGLCTPFRAEELSLSREQWLRAATAIHVTLAWQVLEPGADAVRTGSAVAGPTMQKARNGVWWMHRCKREFLQTQPTVEFDEVLIRPFMQPELLQSTAC